MTIVKIIEKDAELITAERSNDWKERRRNHEQTYLRDV